MAEFFLYFLIYENFKNDTKLTIILINAINTVLRNTISEKMLGMHWKIFCKNL